MLEQDSIQTVSHKLHALNAICREITAVKQDRPFEFMALKDYTKVAASDPGRMAQIYWTEIFYRAHVASMTALVRHSCWMEACLDLCGENPNFLGFAACLRGLLENAADTFFSLRAVPLTIASQYKAVEEVMRGHHSSTAFICEELEQLLIHFLYARKLDASEDDPGHHKAAAVFEYVNSLVDNNDATVKKLYTELCQLAHPAAQSVQWLLRGPADSLWVGSRRDREAISSMLERHADALDTITDVPVNISISILKLLNMSHLDEVRTGSADRFTPPGWKDVEAAIAGSYS